LLKNTSSSNNKQLASRFISFIGGDENLRRIEFQMSHSQEQMAWQEAK
jgi:hypothetical protein